MQAPLAIPTVAAGLQIVRCAAPRGDRAGGSHVSGRRDHRRRRRRRRPGGGARAGHGRPRGDGAGAARADRLGDHLAQQRGDPRRHLLSAGQPARDAVRARQGAALRASAPRTACRTRAAASCWWRRSESQLPKLAAIRETAEPRTASPTWSRSAAMRRARWSRSSPASRRCSRPRPASSTATASCWRWRATSRPTAARWCCAARSSASSATPAGLFRLTTGGDNPGAITCQQPRHLGRPARLQAGAHAGLRRRLHAARDLLRQGPVLRALGPLAVQAPHLSDARRRLARAARHGRHRRALQVRPRHRVDPRHRLRLRAGEARASSSTSSAATIRASRSSACTPTTRASAPSSTARASRCPTSPSTAPTTHGQDGPRRALRHREPGADGVARDRRGGGGDAAAASLEAKAAHS